MVNMAMHIDPETGKGDIVVGKDGIQRAEFLKSALLCCLYGGNVEADTQTSYERAAQNGAYWGNAFLQLQYNSQTERALNNTVLPQEEDGLRAAAYSDVSKLLDGNHITEISDIVVSQSQRRVDFAVYVRTLFGIRREEI